MYLKHHFLISAPMTGMVNFYSPMMQEWAKQTWDNRDVECYCLDAPDYVPTGITHTVGKGQLGIGQAMFARRYNPWEDTTF